VRLEVTGNDRNCVQACLNSHPEAYRALVERYESAVLAYLAGALGDTERAEDAAQETFVRAFFSLGKLQKPESFFSWLMGIARRVAREQRRTERRHRQTTRLAAERGAPPQAAGDPRLERALAELPESYRRIVLLRYYAGLSCSQVAERLAVPLGTVTKKLSRAYRMLRETMQRDDHSQAWSEVKP
jgi:RNA polymerase sigma-70 factor (ECF subfamily)